MSDDERFGALEAQVRKRKHDQLIISIAVIILAVSEFVVAVL